MLDIKIKYHWLTKGEGGGGGEGEEGGGEGEIIQTFGE